MLSATAVCRAVSVFLFSCGLSAATFAVGAFPPIAERWILVDGSVHSQRARMLLYGSCFAGLIVASACMFGARAMWRAASSARAERYSKLTLVVASSVLVALMLVEVGLRVFVPVERVLSREAARYHDWKNSDWHSADRAYMPSIAIDPQLGWAPRNDYRSDAVSVNSAGFRGRVEYAVEKPAGVRRILLIGDSYTWGERTWSAELRDEDTIGSYLQRDMPTAEVMNLAVSGYGSDQALLRLEQIGLRYAPDVVVLGIFTEDLDRNTFRFHTYAKPYFTLERDELQLCGTPIPSEAEVCAEWDAAERPASFALAMARKSWEHVWKRTRFASKWRLSEKILERCARVTNESGGRLVLLHFPVEGQFETSDVAELHLRHWAEANSVPFVAAREAFLTAPIERRGQIYDGHLTPYGNRLVAGALEVALRRSGLAGEK